MILMKTEGRAKAETEREREAAHAGDVNAPLGSSEHVVTDQGEPE